MKILRDKIFTCDLLQFGFKVGQNFEFLLYSHVCHMVYL